MYSIFPIVLLLFLFRSTFAVDLVFILASEEEVKRSLTQVDQFSDKFRFKKQLDGNYLNSIANQQVNNEITTQQDTIETNSDEADSSFLVGENNFKSYFNDENKLIFINKKNRVKEKDKITKDDVVITDNLNKLEHFIKSLAFLNSNVIKKGSTRKRSHAFLNSKDLVKPNINFKSDRNTAKATADILYQVEEKLKEAYENMNNVNKNDVIQMNADGKIKQSIKVENISKFSRGDQINYKNINYLIARREDQEFDIFGDMMFPTKSEFPITVSLNTIAVTPAVLKEAFDDETVEGGPEVDILGTPTPTTELDVILLNPKDYGYTTTHKPIDTFGDIEGYPSIDPEFLTTTAAPEGFAAIFRSEMAEFNMGPFSVAMLKMFDFGRYKPDAVLWRLAWGFGRLIERFSLEGKIDDFGQPTKRALVATASKMAEMPPDEVKAKAILLHNSLVHRREMFSQDLNSIMDNLDSLYRREEVKELIESLEPLDAFKSNNTVPYTLLDHFVHKLLTPWNRLKDTPRREILREAISRAIRNHFYPNPEKEDFMMPRRNAVMKVKAENNPANQKRFKIRTKAKHKNGTNFRSTSLNDDERRQIDESKIIQWIPKPKYRNDDIFEKTNVSISRSNNLDPNNPRDMYNDANAMTNPPTTTSWNDFIDNDKYDNSKKIIEINKKNDGLRDLGLQMASRQKKHHKKHHQKHKHTHRSMKHKLSKILKIIKMYRPNSNHKRSRHKRHRHRHGKHNRNLRAGKTEGVKLLNSTVSVKNATPNQFTELNPIITNRDRRFHDKETKMPTYQVPTELFYEYTTQVYEVKYSKSLRRNKKRKPGYTFHILKKFNEEYDEEIPRKSNYKVIAVPDKEALSYEDTRPENNKRGGASSESCASNEGRLPKRKIYFENIRDY